MQKLANVSPHAKLYTTLRFIVNFNTRLRFFTSFLTLVLFFFTKYCSDVLAYIGTFNCHLVTNVLLSLLAIIFENRSRSDEVV